MMEGLREDSGSYHGETLIHGSFVLIVCVMGYLPFSSRAARGGVTVLLKLMEDAFMWGLLMGTL